MSDVGNVSEYAPWDPQGPLPPEFLETHVRQAYRAVNLTPAHLLGILDKKADLTAVRRLRELLDDPLHRGKLARHREPNGMSCGLHLALYSWLSFSQTRAAPVYKRVIEPAEEEVDELRSLVVARFRDRVRLEKEQRQAVVEHVQPKSDDEVLALYALGYGLYQPTEGRAIVEALIDLGPGFARFFGVRRMAVEASTPAPPAVVPERPARPSVTPPPPVHEHAAALFTHPVEMTSSDSPKVRDGRFDHRPGRRETRLNVLLADETAARARRRALGAADVLARAAFDTAIAAEDATRNSVAAFTNSIRGEASRLVARVAVLLQSVGIDYQPEPIDGSTHDLTRWMDNRAADLEDLGARAEGIQRELAALREFDCNTMVDLSPISATTAHDVLPILEARISRVEAAFLEARSWRDVADRLRTALRDCLEPTPSRSLRTVAQADIAMLLRRAIRDERLRGLSPLLVRWLAERQGWGTESRPSPSAETLRDALRYAGGDAELHDSLLCFLPVPFLQDLLRLGDERIDRHVTLFAFRQAVAAADSIFFDAVWGYAGWTQRSASVGEDLSRALDALRRLAGAKGTASAAFAVLLQTDTENSAADTPEHLRRAAAAEVAQQIENATGMSGNYYVLRRHACELFLRPLKTLVLSRRRREVQEAIVRLDRGLASGELVEQAIDAFEKDGGERHLLRKSHFTNTRRYLEHQVALLKRWVRTESGMVHADVEDRKDWLHEEACRLVKALIQHFPEIPGQDPGSAATTLSMAIAATILAARAGDPPKRTPILFGNLSEDVLPLDPDSLEAWSAFGLGDPGPHHVRMWAARVRGEFGWEDILQDALANALLMPDRTPEKVARKLLEAGELEAAVATAEWPGYSSAECLRTQEEARRLAECQREIEERLYALNQRLGTVRTLLLTSHETETLCDAERFLMEGLSAAAKYDFEVAAANADKARFTLDQTEAAAKLRDALHTSRIAELKRWISETGEEPLNEGLDVLEAQQRDVINRAAPRRRHILRLASLDRAEVPASLRVTIRRLKEDIDQPKRWPTAESSANVDLYLEYLAELGAGWWKTLEALQPEDSGYQRVQAIAETLAARLPAEIEALARGEGGESAPCLTGLLDTGSKFVSRYYATLRNAHLLLTEPLPAPQSASGPDDTPSAGEASQSQTEVRAPETPGPVSSARQNLVDRAEASIRDAATAPGSGADVENAFQCFIAEDPRGCRVAAGRAWSWSVQVANRDWGEAMVALYGWAEASESDSPDVRRGGLALLCALSDAAIRRAQLGVERFGLEWLRAWGESPASSAHEFISHQVIAVSEEPASAPEREALARLLRSSDTLRIARLLWDSVRNKGDATARARKALLRLLYDFEHDDVLAELLDDTELRRYVRPFIALSRRASTEPSPRLRAALQLSLRTLHTRVDARPFREFAQLLVRDLGVTKARVYLSIVGPLEKRSDHGYRLLVAVEPDESDPPIELELLLVEQDFEVVGDVKRGLVGDAPLLLDRKEVEYHVVPKVGSAARVITLRAVGESASGQRIEEEQRFPVVLSDVGTFAPLNADDLLDIYEGCNGKPVTREAFIGRDAEMQILEHAVARGSPGAVILYGARRLGKTSLLDEMRRRYCVSQRGEGSSTLFLVVPVDQFEFDPARSGRGFTESFFKLVTDSVRADTKNQHFREMLAGLNVGAADLAMAAKLDSDFASMPFLAQLRVYLSNLKRLAHGRVGQFVLVFDEFDKLLESYRKGLEASVHELVNQLRRAATEEQVGIVLAGSDLMRRILGTYRSAMFGSATEIELSCFDAPDSLDDATRIIAPDRIRSFREFPQNVITQIVALTGGHPLYMQIVAAASAFTSERRTISPGTVTRAVQELMAGRVLAGRIAHPRNLVTQPLQAIKLLDSRMEEDLGQLLLLKLAYHTSLEKPWTQWGRLSTDDALLGLRMEAVWTRLRDQLVEAKALVRNDKGLWSFRFPIVGEALRIGWELEFETIRARVLQESAA